MNKDLVERRWSCWPSRGMYYTWSTNIAESTLSDEVGADGLPRALAIIARACSALS